MDNLLAREQVILEGLASIREWRTTDLAAARAIFMAACVMEETLLSLWAEESQRLKCSTCGLTDPTVKDVDALRADFAQVRQRERGLYARHSAIEKAIRAAQEAYLQPA